MAHRIDSTGATDDNLFTNGDPALAVPSTEVDADWLNMTQEELLYVIEQAGLTPTKGTNTQLKQAILAHIAAALIGVSTPAQFDNDTSLATTAFVQRALGNNQAFSAVAATATLTAAYAGRVVQFNAGAPFTATLPLASTCPAGSRIQFYNCCGVNITLARQGTDSIYTPMLGVLTSIVFAPGDTLTLVSSGTGWYMIGGSLALPKRVKCGMFTRDISLASGNQSITGVGFTPKKLTLKTLPLNAVAPACDGFTDGTTNECAIYNNESVAGQTSYANNLAVIKPSAAANSAFAVLTSFDADGFTLGWTKTGTPTGTWNLIYCAEG